MNNVQFYLAMAAPTLAVLLGVYFNQRSLDRREGRLSGRIDGLERRMDRLEARLDRIAADLREFYRTLGQHEARLDNLEKRGA
jgi:chromosome segregation ATPase